MNFLKNPTESRFVQKVAALLFGLFILQFALGAFLIYSITLQETSTQLTNIARRVQEDITFTNGKWNTNRYNADPELPGTYPLYVFASDGFVIDRWKPIHGFLDTSDAKKLLSYTNPQTLSTDTDQTWRVLSKPLVANGQQIGVITVGEYSPPSDQLATVDTNLTENVNFILSKISVKNAVINTDNLDPRDISYNVVFQIVDSYNRIITKTDNNNSIDRMPNFIDTSYIGDIITDPHKQTVQDTQTGEKFLVLSEPILNKNNSTIGVIVVGKSIAFYTTIVRDYLIAEGIVGLLLTITALGILLKLSKQFALRFSVNQSKPAITSLSFDKKSGILFVNTEKIAFPYATNQYYLLTAIFTSPKKRWESDEILERFGETDNANARKVYDAMTLINKKLTPLFDEKLILIKDKCYQLNPELLDKLD